MSRARRAYLIGEANHRALTIEELNELRPALPTGQEPEYLARIACMYLGGAMTIIEQQWFPVEQAYRAKIRLETFNVENVETYTPEIIQALIRFDARAVVSFTILRETGETA